jgi:predicted ferric reductase
MRRLMFEFFLKLHLILALVALIALLKHVSPGGGRSVVFPAVALSLWGSNNALRLIRITYYHMGSKLLPRAGQATITPFASSTGDGFATAMVVKLTLGRALRIRPGQYVYLAFTDLGLRRRFQSHPYIIAWWDNSLNATSLSFLVEPRSGISRTLLTRHLTSNVVMDGPYGKDLQLENYETVILIAKGIGIAGILPYARHITYRRTSKDKAHEAYRRGLITRKLDIFWIMEDNCQQDWLSDWISELHAKDSEKVPTHNHFLSLDD